MKTLMLLNRGRRQRLLKTRRKISAEEMIRIKSMNRRRIWKGKMKRALMAIGRLVTLMNLEKV
jgi:hypothetical protein